MEIKEKVKRTRTRLVCAFTIIFILIFFIFSFNCFASNTNLVFTEDIYYTIVSHFSNNNYNSFYTSHYSENYNLNFSQMMQTINKNDLINTINSQLDIIKPNIDSDITMDDIIVAFYYNKVNTGCYIYWDILIPRVSSRKNKFVRLTFDDYSSYYSYNYYFTNMYNEDYKINCRLEFNENKQYTGNTTQTFQFANQNADSKTYQLNISNNEINIPFFLAFKDTMQVKYNSNYYNLVNYEILQQNYIEDEVISENGYKIFSGDPLQLNLYDTNKLLKTYFYIGNNLQFENYYYYYDENNNKINTKFLIDLIDGPWPQSGDSTGILYQPNSQWVHYSDYFGKDIYQDLIVYYYSGDEFLEEKTVIENEKVITWIDSNNHIITGTTGTITNQSGEVIGNYSGENDETDILGFITEQPNLSNKEISSGEITSALNFELESDPYQNMWVTITNGLKEALLSSVRTHDITFKGNTYTINLDDYTTKEPTAIKVFFGTISTVLVVFQLFRWIKESIDKISSGDIDSVLKENQEEGITNLF